MKSSQLIWIVVILILAAGVLIWGLKRSGAYGNAKMPDHLAQQPMEKIDETSLEVMEKPYTEWLKLGQENGKYKNPNTGKYTMVTVMTCRHCGAKIPEPQTEADIMNFKCPKCGR